MPASVFSAEASRRTLAGHVPAAMAGLTMTGRLPGTNHIHLAIGLPLRNEAGLDELLQQLYDPHSTNFHKYLTPAEFTARFGPTEQDYRAVIEFAETNGLTVTGRHGNRVVLDVEGSVSHVEQAFQITLRVYRHPTEARTFYAPDIEPSVDADVPVLSVSGLDNFALPHPNNLEKNISADATPQSGSGTSGAYAGHDFRAAYVPGAMLDGSGQSVALLEFDGYYANDITSYKNTYGLPAVTLTNVAVDGGVSTPGGGNSEVALDIEMVIAMAPGLSKVIVYEAPNPSPWPDLLNRIANDNLARQISCSWGGGSPNATSEQIFKQMAAQGQSFFNASGDSDAFSGSIPFPSDSTNITQVGGTTLTTTGPGGSWSSETVWNWGSSKGKSTGSSGGSSTYYPIPSWQLGINMTTNLGSTTMRNVPDVALTADNILVNYNNGSSGIFGGTSAAAPLWAAFTALVNQQAAAASQPSVGFVNPAIYAIGKGANFVADFHDITTGNDFTRTSSPNFSAVPGYDLCTGWGTPNGTNLINALAPTTLPFFTTQPVNLTILSGSNTVFSAAVNGAPPFSYQWSFNGSNLSDGGNISGTTSNVLSITPATTNNAGNYQIIAANSFGSVTSSVAVLNVGFAPGFSAAPAGLTVLSGSSAVFSATIGGSTPLIYQWRKNGTNLVNGSSISGATSNVLTLTAVTTNSGGNYSLLATNIFGVSTSSVATLTVVLPPVITSSSLTNRIVQCGSNNFTFAITASGTPPLSIQWSLDGSPVLNATSTSFSLTNLHLPSHAVTVVVTNLYSSITSNVVVTVIDTLAPVIALNGGNPIYVELGGGFTDLGATAGDSCAGPVAVNVSGSVNTNVTGTNVLTYIAGDGNGNSNSVTRTVIVRDTTPPTILWSFTNLTLAADSNCSALMPDVTGTNFILATDLSGPLTVSQSPTNGAILSAGTNAVVLAVADASGNKAYSTNVIVVLDQTPPVITLNGDDPFSVELGGTFTDPGATANDTCAGSVAVTASGSVNTGVIGTNVLTYTASDSSGNTNSATRSVIVRDTTPPTILWSFTNLTLAAETNCSAPMPDVTTTNFILAADLSGPLTVSQSPTNGAILSLGTNTTVIAVADAYGNIAYSTNAVVVLDQTPPVILIPPQSQTNLAGTAASFSVAAAACTPLAWQWNFNGTALDGQTNGTLTLSNLHVSATGDYSVTITASGGSVTSAVANLTVLARPATVTLESSANPSGFNDIVNFTATITPAFATGSIQFYTNAAEFVSQPLLVGQASTNPPALPRGTNFITAIYPGDADDLPATNTLAQIVTNHPPAAATVFYTRAAGLPLNIAIAGLATNWTDVDGDPVSLADISASTNGVTLTNNAGTLVYFNASNVADQFTATINDDWGGTNFQTVNIAVAFPGIAALAANGDGSVTLNFNGAPEQAYILETTTNLTSPAIWLPIATNTLDTNGVWQFTDTSATNFPQQFYRLELLPGQ